MPPRSSLERINTRRLSSQSGGQLHQDHFKHERVQGLVDSVSAAANVNKSSNVRQEATGVTDTVDNVMSRFGLEKYSKLTKSGGYQNFLLHELDARGFNDFFKPQTLGAKGRPKKRELKGFKALMDTLKEMEAARVAVGDTAVFSMNPKV
jgi:hypothetical protein